MNVNIRPKNYTDNRKYSVAEFNAILSFLNGLPSIVELNGKADKKYVDMLALAQYTGYAEANTVPIVTDSVIKYDASAGVTYANFKNSNGTPITIPTEVGGEKVIRASLIGMRNVWQYEVGVMNLAGYLPTSQKGAANGVATLGTDLKLPLTQIPDLGAQYVSNSLRGIADGVPTLDSNAKIPANQYNTDVLATKADVSSLAPINGASNSLESAFVNIKTLSLGVLSNGRMTNISSADTNASYKKTDFIPVHPTWILNADRTKDVNSWHIMYDEFKNALGRFNPALGIDTSLHPKTRFIRFSDLNGYMNAVTITVKESIGLDLAKKVNETELKKVNEQSAVDNYFNWEENIPNATLSAGAIIGNAGGLRTTPFMKLKEGHSGWLVVAPIYNSINPWGIAFYTADGTYISLVSIPAGGTVMPLFGAQWRYGEVQVPAEAVYFRLRWDHRAENTDAQLQSLRIIDREAWRIFLVNSFFSGEINSARIRDIILGDKVIDNSLASKFICKLGDSITANNAGQGSWSIWFNGALNPRSTTSRATGGATLTSNFVGFGQDYLNDGNTFLRQCETVYRDIEAGTIAPPDMVIIMGGTNDFDNTLRSFVTQEELAASGLPYDEYMESTFYANSPSYNTLKPLTDVPRNKVAGAIRYIVERLGTISPNTIFVICTPMQSTIHNQLNAERVVRDIKWIANRLSIQLIDCWGKSGMTMLWDFSPNRRFTGDGVHPFTSTGQTRGAYVLGRFVVNELLKIFIPNA